jgi:hypothetical protein
MGVVSFSKGRGRVRSKQASIEPQKEIIYVDRPIYVDRVVEVEKVVNSPVLQLNAEQTVVEVPYEVVKVVEKVVYVDKPIEIIKEIQIEKVVEVKVEVPFEVRVPVITRVHITPVWAKALLGLIAIELIAALVLFL